MFRLYNTLVYGRESLCIQKDDEMYIYINAQTFIKNNTGVEILPFRDTFGYECWYNIKLLDENDFKIERRKLGR